MKEFYERIVRLREAIFPQRKRDFRLLRVIEKGQELKAPEAKRAKSDDFSLVLPLASCLKHEASPSPPVLFLNSQYTRNAMPSLREDSLSETGRYQSIIFSKKLYILIE